MLLQRRMRVEAQNTLPFGVLPIQVVVSLGTSRNLNSFNYRSILH